MSYYNNKRILIIFTGGTVAGNVAKSKISQNVKSDPNTFLGALENSIDIIKKNWNIKINADLSDIINVDSSNIKPNNWTQIIEEIEKKYDEYDGFIVLH